MWAVPVSSRRDSIREVEFLEHLRSVRATLRELFVDAVDEPLITRSPVPAS
jgi:hypothetical protein